MNAEELLRKVVMAWDAGQDEDFIEAVAEARQSLGLTLVADHEDVLDALHSESMREDRADARRRRREDAL